MMSDTCITCGEYLCGNSDEKCPLHPHKEREVVPTTPASELQADGLLPCPFCGAPAEVMNVPDGVDVRCSEYEGSCPAFVSVPAVNRGPAIAAWNTRTPPPQEAPAPVSAVAIQSRIAPWMQECFGPVISADRLERSDRFIEEALELVQACGYERERAHALVEYVFNRPIGEKGQEVGGTLVTLAALCLAHGINMETEGRREVDRISAPEIIAKIRAKQAAKPTGSALPIAPTRAQADDQPYMEMVMSVCPELETHAEYRAFLSKLRDAYDDKQHVEAYRTQAGSAGEPAARKPDGYKYRYPAMFGNGSETVLHDYMINGRGEPLEVVPYYYGTPAPTDVAAYREVTLDDAENFNHAVKLSVDEGDMDFPQLWDVVAGLQAIHAVIRCPEGK